MTADRPVKIIDVNADNVESTGFFWLRSKRNSEGYRRKRAWLEARFAEGLRINMGAGEARGFIEYIPGATGWRAVHGEDHMLIHCVWVAGRSKGHGLGAALLQHCVEDARALGLSGIAAVTSERTWLAGPKFYAKHGFEPIQRTPPSFALMVKQFKSSVAPRFPNDWQERAARCPGGLVVLRTTSAHTLPERSMMRASARDNVVCPLLKHASRPQLMSAGFRQVPMAFLGSSWTGASSTTGR